jgi:sulfate/thiosulfate transport system substrate-binding protein
MRRIWIALAAVLIFAGSATGAAQKTKLTLVAYSTPKEAYGKIISAFKDTNAGRNVDFSQSYGSSGEQARAVKAGLKADIVALSLEPDVSYLVRAGIVPRGWNRERFNGMVTKSVVVFVVRDGNPKKIRGWSDLVRKGIDVVTPNPFTSGGARWNVMAAYGAQRKQGKSHKQAVDYLYKLFHHVVSQDKSAREALQTFAAGKGDVLITYENEAIFANKKGVRTDYVTPRQTILIENPVALTRTGVRKKEARAFLAFLRSAKAQKVFADNGYRPVLSSVTRQFGFKRPVGLFTIRKLGLGGWDRVEKRFFDPRSGIMAKVERSLGR